MSLSTYQSWVRSRWNTREKTAKTEEWKTMEKLTFQDFAKVSHQLFFQKCSAIKISCKHSLTKVQFFWLYWKIYRLRKISGWHWEKIITPVKRESMECIECNNDSDFNMNCRVIIIHVQINLLYYSDSPNTTVHVESIETYKQ